jgi:hypothetical protein
MVGRGKESVRTTDKEFDALMKRVQSELDPAAEPLGAQWRSGHLLHQGVPLSEMSILADKPPRSWGISCVPAALGEAK